MGLPILKLNLVPPPSLWRQHHVTLGRAAMALGLLCLAGVLGQTWQTRHLAEQAGRQAVLLAGQGRDIARQEAKLIADLKEIDVEREAPRWKLAERILTERSVPWTRITSELERSMAQDVRLKSIQRTRTNDRQVEIKIKGEAKSREAEVAFMNGLQKNAFFGQVVLEREAERQGGGIDFDYTLIAAEAPPAFSPLPLYGPPRTPSSEKNAVPPSKPPLAVAKALAPTPPPPMAKAPSPGGRAPGHEPQTPAQMGQRPMSPAVPRPPIAPRPGSRP